MEGRFIPPPKRPLHIGDDYELRPNQLRRWRRNLAARKSGTRARQIQTHMTPLPPPLRRTLIRRLQRPLPPAITCRRLGPLRLNRTRRTGANRTLRRLRLGRTHESPWPLQKSTNTYEFGEVFPMAHPLAMAKPPSTSGRKSAMKLCNIHPGGETEGPRHSREHRTRPCFASKLLGNDALWRREMLENDETQISTEQKKRVLCGPPNRRVKRTE